MFAFKKLPMDVVGDVSGRIAIIVVSFPFEQKIFRFDLK